MQLSLIFTFAFQSLEGNDSCRMKIRALYHYNEPSFYPKALCPYENEAGISVCVCVSVCVHVHVHTRICILHVRGSEKYYNNVSKLPQTFEPFVKQEGVKINLL